MAAMKIGFIEQIYFKISGKKLAILRSFEVRRSLPVGTNSAKSFRGAEQYLIELTTLTSPSSGAPLLLYVAASHAAFSVALVQEKQDGQAKRQVPVYFVSEVLSPSKKITQSWKRYYMLY
jgi:hypothetical protein